MVRGAMLHEKSVAYAATTLGASFIHPVFTFYYVKVYLNRFHVSEPWFDLAQVIFLIWNAVNDPLFGCLQDYARSKALLTRRRHSILYGAPLFVVAFILPWFPWANYESSGSVWLAGIQLSVVLCFYDAMFTYVLLAHGALLAELSTNQADRVRMVQYGQAAGLFGSVSVLICETTSSGLEHYGRFQMTCVGLGIAAGACFIYTGLNADTQFDCVVGPASEPERKPRRRYEGVLRQTRQIFAQRSFVSFVLVNFCQTGHFTFLANFTNITGNHLLSTGLSSLAKNVLYGSLFVIPRGSKMFTMQLLVIAAAPLVSRIGYYRVIRASFILKVFTGLSFLLIGRDHPWIIAAFFVVESANTNAPFMLFGLCLSDVIDADMQQHHHSHPLSSMVFGLNALVTKPAISVAPMITVALLNSYGYSSTASSKFPGASTSTVTASEIQRADSSGLTDAMFYVTCAVPIVTGILQLLIWRFYTIRDSHKTRHNRPTVSIAA